MYLAEFSKRGVKLTVSFEYAPMSVLATQLISEVLLVWSKLLCHSKHGFMTSGVFDPAAFISYIIYRIVGTGV